MVLIFLLCFVIIIILLAVLIATAMNNAKPFQSRRSQPLLIEDIITYLTKAKVDELEKAYRHLIFLSEVDKKFKPMLPRLARIIEDKQITELNIFIRDFIALKYFDI